MTLDSRADELDKKMQENNIVDNSIETLVKDANRRRRQLRLLAISLALDFIITIGLAVLSIKTNEVAELAQNNKDAVIQNCETANDSRKNQRELWSYVISLTPEQPRTPEQSDRVDEFAKFVNKTFAQRNCQAEVIKASK